MTQAHFCKKVPRNFQKIIETFSSANMTSKLFPPKLSPNFSTPKLKKKSRKQLYVLNVFVRTFLLQCLKFFGSRKVF